MDTHLSLERLDGVGAFRARYDAWLCDVWGVVHDGVRPFARAVDALVRFREGGGVVVLISNSPRPEHSVRLQLDELTVPAHGYDGVVTSGDVTRGLIEAQTGQRFLHLGPARDRPLFEGLDAVPADLQEADFVLCTGLYDDESEGPEDYRELLQAIAARGLVMICANPDHVVQRGDRLIYCAGALAALYEELGGRAVYAGKPHPPIYQRALARIAALCGGRAEPSRILAIGDNPDTDIAGAAAAGLDALFIAGGIGAGQPVEDARGDGPGRRLRLELPVGPVAGRVIGYLPELTW